jgi:hypothetical protein
VIPLVGTLSPVTDRSATPPPASEELVKRMMAVAERNGLEFVMPN